MVFPYRWSRGFLILLVAFPLFGLPGRARAEGFREGLASFAKDISEFLAKSDYDAIDVGEFTGPATPVTSAGPGIQKTLIEELTKKKVLVKPGANLYIKGEYILIENTKDKERERVLLRLEAKVRDKTGKVLLEFVREIESTQELVKNLGATGYLPPKADDPDRNEKLNSQIKKPGVFIDGKRIQARKGSPYSVEIQVRRAGGALAKPLTPTDEKGLAFVPIKKGDYYEIVLRNDSDKEAAVSVSIDGLDMFTFSKIRNKKNGQPQFTHWIIGRGKALVVKGWHIDNKTSDRFEVSSFGDSEAAKLLKGNAKVGVITVCFHAAWEGKTPPEDEKGSRSADSLGTKRGPPVDAPTKAVQRTVGVLREFVSVRYGK
jgi:hypothetical protein